MIIVILQVFVSLMLVAGAIALFVFTVRSRTLEHADRLSLAPLDDDTGPSSSQPPPQSQSALPGESK